MAEFMESLNTLKPSLPFLDMDQSLELMNHFAELNGNVMENPNLGLMGFANDFGLPCIENLSGFLPTECPKPATVPNPVASIGEQSNGDKKRKAMAPETSSGNSSEIKSGETKTKKKNSSGSGKRGRNNSKEEEKLKEVVHVRARRGQATDSHSLAERVRREKINERMRYLQDLVPGCYKTMGMAGMLDEIINYVQSLQNQVEFLSMKLSAASSYCDFSLEMEAMATQQVDNSYEAQEVERLLVRDGYGSCCTSFQSTMPF